MNLLWINYDCLESWVRGKNFEQLKTFVTSSQLLKNCKNCLRIYMNQLRASQTDYDSTKNPKSFQLAIRGIRGLCGIVAELTSKATKKTIAQDRALFFSFFYFSTIKYRIYPMYWDASTASHTCSKLWTSTIYYLMFTNCWMSGKL